MGLYRYKCNLFWEFGELEITHLSLDELELEVIVFVDDGGGDEVMEVGSNDGWKL